MEPSLSDAQEKVLALLPVIPSILSIVSSALVMRLVWRNHFVETYQRLLFAMSVCDVICTANFVIEPFITPHETSRRIWAVGNDSSCLASGFFYQFSSAAAYYNCMLTVYFVLVIRFNVKEAVIAKWVEPSMHLLSIVYPLVTASVGTARKVWTEAKFGPGCWVTPESTGCDLMSCCLVYGWLLTATPMFAALAIVLVNNYLILNHVKATIDRNNSYGVEGPAETGRREKVQEVAMHCILYVSAFGFCWIWPTLINLLGDTLDLYPDDEARYFPLFCFNALLFPLLGVFNLLVFVRSRYLRCRKKYPNSSRLLTWGVVIWYNVDQEFEDRRKRRGRRRFQVQDTQSNSSLGLTLLHTSEVARRRRIETLSNDEGIKSFFSSDLSNPPASLPNIVEQPADSEDGSDAGKNEQESPTTTVTSSEQSA